MSYLSEMEWSTKWDWESLAVYGSKAIESPKKLHLAELMMADDGEIEAGSFNVSGNGNISGVSGSDGGFQGSSGKSSVSASTDSSTKDGTQTPNFKFMGFEGSSFNLNKNVKLRGTEASRTSSAMEASIGSVEPVIGLKLGKRTYFENNCAGGNVKSTSLSVVPSPCAVTQKKTKSSGKSANIPRCQVEECNLDLSMAKEYHQKHRVCDVHSKSPKVVIGGHERRFCQQCSRFHSLLEFDEKKRSCRRRLSDHNARRRKPHQETMQFSSTTLSSPFYGGRQQLNFLLNDSPLTHSVTPANSTWDISSCNSKFTLTKDYHFKRNNNGGTHEQLHMSGVKLPPVTIMHNNFANGLLASKSFKSEVLSPGSRGTLISSSHLDAAAPTYRRALSLLSNNSWGGSCAPDSVPVQHHRPILHEKDTTSCITHHQPMMNSAIPEGDPLSCSGLWPPSTGHHLTHPHPRIHSFAQNGNFQEIQLLETPYEADFYSNILN